jgi:C-terminal processing protease CtpA/Prc
MTQARGSWSNRMGWRPAPALIVLMLSAPLAQAQLVERLEQEIQAQTARFLAAEEEKQKEEVDEADLPVSDDEFRLPVDERMAADIERMIGQLALPEYAERKSAYDGLIEIGAPAMRFLRDEYARTEDLEVRLSIERIVYRAYLDHHVYSRHAFLGISLQPYFVARADDEHSPINITGVRVVNVISGTAAERAGLLNNDIIIASEGKPLTGTGQTLVENFSRTIASRQPGARMQLTVARPEGRYELEVTLGRVPRERVQQTSIREKYFHTDRRFAVWWDQYFVGEGAAQPDPK